MATKRQTQRVMKMLGDLTKADDRWVATRAKRLRDQMQRPMAEILKKVPGETVMEKAAAVGISRQAYYAWVNGISRPNTTQAKKLAKMTGLTIEQIRGREVYQPPRVNPAPKPRPRKRKVATSETTAA